MYEAKRQIKTMRKLKRIGYISVAVTYTNEVVAETIYKYEPTTDQWISDHDGILTKLSLRRMYRDKNVLISYPKYTYEKGEYEPDFLDQATENLIKNDLLIIDVFVVGEAHETKYPLTMKERKQVLYERN